MRDEETLRELPECFSACGVLKQGAHYDVTPAVLLNRILRSGTNAVFVARPLMVTDGCLTGPLLRKRITDAGVGMIRRRRLATSAFLAYRINTGVDNRRL